MTILPNKDPFLIQLEVEEAFEYMLNNKTEDINQTWLNLFLRLPSQEEIGALIDRVHDGKPRQFKNILFSVQTTEIADAYRYHYGKFFSVRKANKICRILFGRRIMPGEALEVKRLTKQSEPYELTDIYKWIAQEVRLIQKQNPIMKIEEIYEIFVLRPPFRFEIQYCQEKL